MSNPEYLPVNPCEGCTIAYPVFAETSLCKGINQHCLMLKEYKSNLAALEKYTECLINRYRLSETYEPVVIELKSMLLKIKEANNELH